MLSQIVPLFLAGLVTILLPCILPLIPIVLGVSIVDRNRWKPLVTIIGMLIGFVGLTFLLQVVLSQFVELADAIRIGTFYVLLLFGLGFLFHSRTLQFAGAAFGSFFFYDKGWIAVIIAAVVGVIAMEVGGRIATKIQQFGTDVQTKARSEFGPQSLLTSFIIGLTMGLVWVPCAGPALGFVLSVIRNQPGVTALLYLSVYALGAGIPLLLIGYGGQFALHSVRALSKYSGFVKQISGVLLIICAIAFRYDWFLGLQTSNIYGDLGTRLENALFAPPSSSSSAGGSTSSGLPILGRAPSAFVGLGPWHNSPPLDLQALRGKVVLIDFWTYSCINCIRTLPYIQQIWLKYQDQPFVLIGVHTPEFIFEKSEKNVSMAITEHGLTYPIAQDNNFGTWNAFHNQYWPAKYLIDADGNIRYEHFGEGNYEATDQAIASLLTEMGATSVPQGSLPPETAASYRPITPETYLHSRGWDSFGNAQGDPSDAAITYAAPPQMDLHTFYLVGTWQLTDDERQVLRSAEGEIRIRALAGEVNLVLGLEDGATSVTADIIVDGKKATSITIDRHDLYTLYKGAYGEHDVILKLHGAGVAAYAFTFGS